MTLGLRPVLALALPAAAGALLMLARPAAAQQEAAKPAGLERAQKAADAVFHWIKLNADKGANRQPTTPAAAPTPAPAPAPAPAKKAAPVAAAAKPAPAAAPTAAPVVTAAAPAPEVVAAAPEPQPAPEAERTPVLLAAASPVPTPAAPLAAAARAAQPPAPAPQEEEAEEPLKLIHKVDPTLPRQLQLGTFRNGFAQVRFTVGTDGAVQQASVIKASHNRLGKAAIEAVSQWRFAPLNRVREAAVEVAFNNDAE